MRGLRVAVEDLLINDRHKHRDDTALTQHINRCHHSNQEENPCIVRADMQTYAVDRFQGLLHYVVLRISFQYGADVREFLHVDNGRRRLEYRTLPLTEKKKTHR